MEFYNYYDKFNSPNNSISKEKLKKLENVQNIKAIDYGIRKVTMVYQRDTMPADLELEPWKRDRWLMEIGANIGRLIKDSNITSSSFNEQLSRVLDILYKPKKKKVIKKAYDDPFDSVVYSVLKTRGIIKENDDDDEL